MLESRTQRRPPSGFLKRKPSNSGEETVTMTQAERTEILEHLARTGPDRLAVKVWEAIKRAR